MIKELDVNIHGMQRIPSLILFYDGSGHLNIQNEYGKTDIICSWDNPNQAKHNITYYLWQERNKRQIKKEDINA